MRTFLITVIGAILLSCSSAPEPRQQGPAATELGTEQQAFCTFGQACTTECIRCCWGDYGWQPEALPECKRFCCGEREEGGGGDEDYPPIAQ